MADLYHCGEQIFLQIPRQEEDLVHKVRTHNPVPRAGPTS
ncbi:hypothetical protein NC652_034112 [Populus alba x Populus x berolinensis]|uniref:Uncharacterized protein n=1 Tax=Populus alba x Populus x berolinensis TaxID=444605 RepID=A0AAD6PZT1_9ROSI|nr:hypothetical protein NC652_034112 [Populus alba x Populus x berolinensis]KAJ6973869.1 hypothetical protein NC653_034020 [Populus alba x Populus x berolinensis]